MSSVRKTRLILDANVLIDLLNCDPTLIPLISRYLGQVIVSVTALEEIPHLSTTDAKRLHILLATPTLGQLITAARGPGPLSFHEWICFLLAKEEAWTCVTNDKALRKRCVSQDVTLLWEFEMLCLLVESGGLSKERCRKSMLSIKDNNPFYITDTILEEAFKRLDR